MCLYPGLCELKIILAHEIIAVIWALLIKKQECFHRWEEMYWPRICLMPPHVSLCRKAEGVSVDLWTLFLASHCCYVCESGFFFSNRNCWDTFLTLLYSHLHLIGFLIVFMSLFHYKLHSFMDVRP